MHNYDSRINLEEAGDVQPLTELYILTGIPFDLGEDTLDFEDSGRQFEYFKRHEVYHFTNLTPISVYNRNISINLVADKLMDCNYIMFKNTNYSNKWYYCVISDIEWVNVNNSIIHFDVDYLQTYLFDYSIPTAFIEREHVNEDSIGKHTIEEGLETGELVIDKILYPSKFTKKYIVLCSSAVPEGNIGAGMYDGLYTGVGYRWEEANEQGAKKITKIINDITDANKSDGIIGIILLPEIFVNGKQETWSIPRPTTIDGYTPKNKKLFTYPYCFTSVSTNDGNYAVFKYEMSSDVDSIEMRCNALMSPNPQCICYPRNYRGTTDDYSSKVTLSGFPQCPYAIDSYKAWFAMNGATTQVGIIGRAMQDVASVVKNPNPLHAVDVGLSSVINSYEQLARLNALQTMPPQVHGSQGGNFNFQTVLPLGTFTAYTQTIKREYAESIDDFFTKYGYRVNRKGVPNTKSRNEYNYVKCGNVYIGGNIPYLAQKEIERRFINGVRFWHNEYGFKNYNLDNEVVE